MRNLTTVTLNPSTKTFKVFQRVRLEFLVRSATVVAAGEESIGQALPMAHYSLPRSAARPPTGVLVNFGSEGIPENDGNDTPTPSCGAGGLHNHERQQPVQALLNTHISIESNI